VEDVVAVAVRLEDGAERFFVTWGRIQDAVDPQPLARLVLQQAKRVDLGGAARRGAVCWSLAEARDAPHFYDALVQFASCSISKGTDYEEWRLRMGEEMEAGRHIYYLGSRNPPSGPHLDVRV
jgi:hypothetical protein